jgi:FMN phosphatase YigB (HAD superfamily)
MSLEYLSIRAIVFDWGDTLMKDFPEYSGPMVFWPRVEIMPGVYELLDLIHERFTCCVASSAGDSDAELMGLALERVNIRKYFNYLFTSKKLGYKKPEIEFFLEICRRLGIIPNECLMIGNDYLKDIVPAKEGELNTVLVAVKAKRTDFPKADFLIDSLEELKSILL